MVFSASWHTPEFTSVLFTDLSSLWGSQDKNTEVVCRSLLQWFTFCLYNLYVVHSHWYYSANHISVNHISFLFIAVRVSLYLKGLELINVTQIVRVK